MQRRITFEEHMRSNNSKVQGNVFILKTIEEQLSYLDLVLHKSVCIK